MVWLVTTPTGRDDSTSCKKKSLTGTLQKNPKNFLLPHTQLQIYAASFRKHPILMPQKMDAKRLEMSPGVASLPRSQFCYVSVHGSCKNMTESMGKRPDLSVDVKGSFSPHWGNEITTILNFRWLYTRENVLRLDTPPGPLRICKCGLVCRRRWNVPTRATREKQHTNI